MQLIPNFVSHVLSPVAVLVIAGFFQPALAQDSGPAQEAHQDKVSTVPSGNASQPPTGSGREENVTPAVTSSSLLIGPGDEVEITVYGAPDLSGHTRVTAGGNVSMPLIGYVRVAGLSASEAEAAIEGQLRQNNVINDPQVSVYVKEYTNSGISVAGEVSRPGVYSALGPHRLFDILQTAGGLSERASGAVTITHKGSEDSPVTVEVSKDPAKMANSNVDLYPGDTVFAAKAAMVYVLGEVNRPGGYILNSTGAVTVLQVVAAAGGPTHAAAAGGTRMIRRTPSGLEELPIPLKELLRGKTTDIPISAEDIIFVPSSRIKNMVAISTVVATSAATAAVYHIY
jgi:polysaccharide export outer membrane protein